MNLLAIDIRTFIVLLAFSNAILLVLMLTYGVSTGRTRIDDVFSSSKILQCLAWMLIGMRGQISDALSFELGNTLLVMGWTLESLSLVSIKWQIPKRLRLTYGVALVFFLAIWWNVIPGLDKTERLHCMTFFVSSLFATVGIALSLRKNGVTLLQRVVGTLYIASSFGYVLRSLLLLYSEESYSIFSLNAAQVLMFYLMYFVLMLGGISYILLRKEVVDNEIRVLATTDSLTGINNRRAFDGQAHKAIQQAIRSKSPLSFLVLDLDRFKRINDEYGHLAGDAVLKSFSETVKGILREYDVFARYGGEEFVLLLPNTGVAELKMVAERIRSRVESLCLDEHGGIRYTVSIGAVCVCPSEETTVDDLIRASDRALYEAKEAGRNRLIIGAM